MGGGSCGFAREVVAVCNVCTWRLGVGTAQAYVMPPHQSRRCALWVTPRTLAAAEQLADFTGVDVDTFIEAVVLDLRDDVAMAGALPTHAEKRTASAGHVIPLTSQRRQARRGRSAATR
jgi:hypothetical protein